MKDSHQARGRDFWVAGVDMGASNLRLARADFRGRLGSIVAERLRPEGGPAGVIAQIKAGIERLGLGRERERKRESARVARGRASRLATIAVGVPSAVDPRTGRVRLANNLPGWRNIDLGRALEAEFHVPVVVDNDANLAALGECWRGVARRASSLVFIALGTGIGAGIVIDGRIWHGRTGNAGEIYRMNLDWRRWADDHGDTGYLESQVAGLGIAAEGRRVLRGRGRSSSQGLVEARDAQFVFQAFRRGDRRARAVLERAFTILGVGVADLVSVLDPDLVVLGGGLAKGAPAFLLETVERVLHRVHPDIAPPVRLSTLGDRAQVYGAILAALAARPRLRAGGGRRQPSRSSSALTADRGTTYSRVDW